MHLEQQIAFSSALIEAGVPEREADEITDCIMVDPMDEVRASIVNSIGCWHAQPERVLRHALICADET